MTHSARAGAALRALAEADPALAALSLWCRHRDHDGPTETAGVEIRYGPGFGALPQHEQVGVAGHHILHVALQHSARMADLAARLGEGFAADLWGIAADSIVNEALLEAGHALPRPALTLTGLLAAALGQVQSPAEALALWDVERLYHRLASSAGRDGAGEKARAHAARQGHAGPDLRPAEGEGGRSGEESRAEWRAHLARAMAAGAAAGFGIGRPGARLADLPRPRVAWEAVLRRLLQRAILPWPAPTSHRPDRAWLACEAEARRQGGPVPVFRPGTLRLTRVPRLVLGLDCSTSIDAAGRARLLGEVAGLARRNRAELHLLPFDTVVHAPCRIDPARWRAELAALALPEGGGTDFRPLIAAAARLAPSALVVLTDLDGPVDRAPRFPVIWAVPETPVPVSAPFGHLLPLDR